MLECLEKTDTESVWMATITRRATGDLSTSALKRAIQREREHWRTITKKLRWDDSRLRKYAETGARSYLRELEIAPPDRVDLSQGSEEIDGAYDDGHRCGGYWPDADGSRTYLWALEATTGAADKGHWHVHRHVICPDRSQAERILAASYLHDDEIQGAAPYRVDLRRWDRKRAAGYLAGYLAGAQRDVDDKTWTSCVECEPVDVQRAYVDGMKGVRRYDAAGDWRPLGMSPDETDDPVVLVGDDLGVYDAQSYYSKWVVQTEKTKRFKALTEDCENSCTSYEQSAWDRKRQSWFASTNVSVDVLEHYADADRAVRLPRPEPPD